MSRSASRDFVGRKSISRIRRLVLQVTFLGVFIVGLVVALSLWGDPNGNDFDLNRIPAALDQGGTEFVVRPEVAVLDLDCDQQSYQVPPVLQVQLKSKICGLDPTDTVKESFIQNETNSFTATVFRSQRSDLTTDFIQLNEGANLFVVRHVFSSGRVDERRITISR